MSDSTTIPAAGSGAQHEQQPRSNGRFGLMLGLVAIGMVLFVIFGLVPLYNMVCNAFGIGESTASASSADEVVIAAEDGRPIKVYFEARALDGLGVLFFPEEKVQTVKPGERTTNTYVFKNVSDKEVHFRPIHNVAPVLAAQHYKMTVCFCFNDQTIAAGDTASYDVVYHFEPDIDPRVSMCTVRYDLHAIEEDEIRPKREGFEE